jgi:hypothetical protein
MNNKNFKIALLSLVISAILLCTFVVLGPFISMLGIQASLENDNEKALNRYIDFPVLQANFKRSMSAQAQESLGFSSNNGILAQFAMRFTNQIIDVAVENAISPSGIVLLLSGEDLNELMVAGNKKTNQEDKQVDSVPRKAQKISGSKDEIRAWQKITNSEFNYISHNEFVFYLKGINEKKSITQLIFLRKGIWWKLSNVNFTNETLIKQ